MAGGKDRHTACRVLDATGHDVGNLKWLRGVRKFKAVGYDASGGDSRCSSRKKMARFLVSTLP